MPQRSLDSGTDSSLGRCVQSIDPDKGELDKLPASEDESSPQIQIKVKKSFSVCEGKCVCVCVVSLSFVLPVSSGNIPDLFFSDKSFLCDGGVELFHCVLILTDVV